ncbi:MAG TPA: hypothetical protein VGH54_26545 [Mycobacterium sp.]|jgi:hypothetical protein|uniref:hypothetical protein n=1 Tax=Mycobacterium sp. TaxID=1785 RepID=UPI002F425E33
MTDYLKITEFDERHTEIEVLACCDISWSVDDATWYTMVYGARPGLVILDWAAPEGRRRSYETWSRVTGETRRYLSGGAARGLAEAINGWLGKEGGS